MKEIIDAVFDTAKERMKNPFIGAFILSWVAFNWKPIIVLVFGTGSVEGRISLIEKNYIDLVWNFVLPICFSLFYVMVLPYIMWLFDKIASKAVKGRKTNIKNQKLFDLEARQDYAKEDRKLENIKAGFRDLTELNGEIEELQQQLEVKAASVISIKQEYSSALDEQRKKVGLYLDEISRKDEKLDTLIDQIEHYKNVVSNLESNLKQSGANISDYNLGQISDVEKSKFFKDYRKFKNTEEFEIFGEVGKAIRKGYSISKIVSQFLIQELVSQKIIERIIVKNGEGKYIFTAKGHIFWEFFLLDEDYP